MAGIHIAHLLIRNTEAQRTQRLGEQPGSEAAEADSQARDSIPVYRVLCTAGEQGFANGRLSH